MCCILLNLRQLLYASVTQGLRFSLFGAHKKKKKGTAKAIPFLWLPKLDSNQRPCG